MERLTRDVEREEPKNIRIPSHNIAKFKAFLSGAIKIMRLRRDFKSLLNRNGFRPFTNYDIDHTSPFGRILLTFLSANAEQIRNNGEGVLDYFMPIMQSLVTQNFDYIFETTERRLRDED